MWSLAAGGTNAAWLTLDAATGLLHGTPTVAELGPVSVTVRVEEPLYPANFAEKTFTFTVLDVAPAVYDTSFEGACPAGWTLTGDWECGTPANVGPASAYDGVQCLGTRLGALYDSLQTWTGATATSPDLTLPGAYAFRVTFRLWVDTEGGSYDGANLKISTDGGMTFVPLTTVTPAYPLTIGGEPAWGGHQSSLGWQAMEADLSAYAGQTVRLQFAFRSDSSGTYPGVYLDDLHLVSP